MLLYTTSDYYGITYNTKGKRVILQQVLFYLSSKDFEKSPLNFIKMQSSLYTAKNGHISNKN